MATITKFEDIESRQKARELKQTVYRVTQRGEFSRDFVLRDPIRRAAISATANIAEGFERSGNRELVHFSASRKVRSARFRTTFTPRWNSPTSRSRNLTKCRRRQLKLREKSAR